MNLPTRALFLAAALLVCGVAHSQAGSYFLQAHAGYSLFNPDDVNNAVDWTNADAGINFLDHFSSGPEAGLRGGYSLDSEFSLGLGFVRLWSGTSGATDGFQVEFDVPADFYEVFLDYLPKSDRTVRFGVGTSMGMVWSDATFRIFDPVVGEQEFDLDGSGFLFTGYAIMDAALSSKWSLICQAGLRHAIISTLKIDGETLYNPDSVDDKLRLNYSGLFLRAGVKFQP